MASASQAGRSVDKSMTHIEKETLGFQAEVKQLLQLMIAA
jgi:hypothetical protein